ncbi:MAG: SigE family RNA polymerase sigma factor [Actinomycetota bacterium]
MSKGRDEEFRVFFDAEFVNLRRLAFMLTGDWTEAEDLAQDTMVRTYNAWDRISGDSPMAYARTALLNRHRSKLRRAKVEAKYAFARRTPTEVVEERDDAVTLIAALKVLPPRERQAIVLRFFEDRPIAEVAEMLEVPPGTVKSMTHRALARLRDELGDPFATLIRSAEVAVEAEL